MEEARSLNLNFHDIASIQLDGVCEPMTNRIRELYGRHVGGPVQTADCRIEFKESVVNLSDELVYITRRAAFSPTRFLLRDRSDRSVVFQVNGSIDFRNIESDTHFDPNMFAEILQLILHSLAIRKDRAFLHACAVARDGEATIFCAWRNTGKTAIVCEMLRRGFQFMGDDWCIISPNGEVYSILKAIRAYAHDLQTSPEVLVNRFGPWRSRILLEYYKTLAPSKLRNVERSRLHWRKLRMLTWAVKKLNVFVHDFAVDPAELAPSGVTDRARIKQVYLVGRCRSDTIHTKPLSSEELADRMVACYFSEQQEIVDPHMLQYAFPGSNARFLTSWRHK